MTGFLNRLLTLEAAERVADGAGGYALDWSVLGQLWAQMRAGTGRERAAQSITMSEVGYVITVRAAPVGSPRRPKAAQRFRDGERVFRILSVSERDLRGMYLDCRAIEEIVV
jgi:head-tail adaptor